MKSFLPMSPTTGVQQLKDSRILPQTLPVAGGLSGNDCIVITGNDGTVFKAIYDE